jgi:hypothetical protein
MGRSKNPAIHGGAAMVIVIRALPSVVAAVGRTQKPAAMRAFCYEALETRQLLLLVKSGRLAGPLSIR